MWITLPSVPGVGIHHVRLPENFNKSVADFPSVADFLKAVRACHLHNRNSR